MIPKTAKFQYVCEGMMGVAALYLLSEPYEGYNYVVASSVTVFGTSECYVFPAWPTGEVINFMELFGLRGSVCHAATLGAMGYETE